MDSIGHVVSSGTRTIRVRWDDGGWNALRKRLDASLSPAAENGKRRIPLCHTVIDINPLDERALRTDREIKFPVNSGNSITYRTDRPTPRYREDN